jgi:ABC-type branched-subunit amino acid transport system substrate-binding protein
MKPLAPAFLLLWAGILTGCAQAERSFRIVTVTDLSGPQSEYGQGIRTAAALALEDQQAALLGAGWRVELSSLDASGSAQELASAVSRLAAQADTLCAVVHTAGGGNIDIAGIFHSAGIPTVLPAETAPVPAGNPLPEILWLSPDDRAHGAADAEWAADGGSSGVFLVLDSGDHAQAIGEGFLGRARDLGVSVTEIHFSPSEKISARLSSADSARPQWIYYSGSLDAVPSILGDLESAGYRGALFIAESEAEDSLPRIAVSGGIRLYFSPAAADSENFSRSAGFAEKYRQAYAAESPPLAALGYDAATFCLRALAGRKASDPRRISPRADILSDWRSGAEWKGVAGEYSADRQRLCPPPVFLLSKETGADWIPAPRTEGTEAGPAGC